MESYDISLNHGQDDQDTFMSPEASHRDDSIKFFKSSTFFYLQGQSSCEDMMGVYARVSTHRGVNNHTLYKFEVFSDVSCLNINSLLKLLAR